MKYPLAGTLTWDHNEFNALQEVIASTNFTMGAKVKQFEEEYATKFGSKYAVMSNSGSSANLLAIAALVHNPNYNLNIGDDVIVPAVSWSTTYFPLMQYGLTMNFVDIGKDSLNIDIEQVEAAITPKTRAIFAVSLLGNPCDFIALQDICDRHDLILIEDNCESLGAKIGDKYTGTFGVAGTFSFFFSHHLQTMEGGMTLTDDLSLYEYMLSLRSHGWTRNLPDNNTILPKTGNAFEDSFKFVLPGYNLRPGEMHGAVGTEQLKKLDALHAGRRANGKIYQDIFSDYQIQVEMGEHSWFGFSFLIDNRNAVIAALSSAGVDTRPIVAGNFMKNPVLTNVKYISNGDYPNANMVDTHGFFLGNDVVDLSEQLNYAKGVMESV